MRSAETSGVGANGFGADQEQANTRQVNDSRSPANPLGWQAVISPITAAVALTALCAATLFVAYDTMRTFEDARHELAVIGSSIAADIAGLAPEAAALAVDTLPQRFNTVTRASLSSAREAVDLPAFLSQFVPAGDHGTLALEATPESAWSAIGQRAGIAFGLAGVLTAFVWRRRRGDMPDLLQRHNYRTLAAAIPMGVACWTKDGSLVVCNEQYRERFKLLGKSLTYHHAVKRMIEGGYMKLLNEDENNRLLEVHRHDGSCLLIDERPLSDGGFMTLVSDVTERKKTDTMLHAIREEQRHLARRYHEEKLKAEAASHAKTNFLAHLSHDIRTPLNHIIGFAELMRHQAYGPLGDERYADYVQSIKTSGEHLLASFATILDLAELENGQKALRRDPVAIDAVLRNVMERFAAPAARAKLALSISQSCDATIEGDQLGLVRMISNIVENSLRFTQPGGQIALAAYQADDGVVIEITDTGIGMNQERLATLSQPFALGDATFTREGMGPGLGISIARAIAELSGGHLVIDSSPSLGTTVAISLPLQVTSDVSVAA
ncbi:ATP-binding protein [Devosia sp. J2-20]|uniref:sensor histidine kinase n=1 Tax=Devosia sp. J2-20 TaxID=3026161 RepID=UPI00249B07CD|nr:PAS domain-containing sensor histidine kinase [Devosia sp. J2-20]WDQ97838.1 ATP-binding protein [Devosia sp. J2-20]